MNDNAAPLPSDIETRPAAPHVASKRTSTSKLHLALVTTRAQLAALEADWNDLFERTAQAHQVFQSFGFASLWATHFLDAPAKGKADRGTTRLAILTARRAGRLVLVWPLVVQREMGLRVLTGLGEPVSQYSDAIVDPGEHTPSILAAAFEHLCRKIAPDLFRLRKVRADAAIAGWLAQEGTRTTAHVEAPFVTLRAGGSAVEERQSGKARKNRRRLFRRLEEQGSVSFRTSAGTEEAAGFVKSGLGSKRDWLVRRGLMSPAIAEPRLDGFLLAAATTGAASTGCRLFAMQLDNRPIAVAIGFQCKRRLMLHLITQTADVERFGTGVLNLEAILRQVESEGLEALDLLPPKADYKEDWADGAVNVCDHTVGLTAAGKIWSLAFDRIVKPRLKQSIDALPLAWRRKLSARSLPPRT